MNVEQLHYLVTIIAIVGVLATMLAGALGRNKLLLLIHLIILAASGWLMHTFVQMGDAKYSAILTAVYLLLLVATLQYGGVIKITIFALERKQPAEG